MEEWGNREAQIDLSESCFAVMTSRPDVMQLLFFFSLKKKKTLTRNGEEKCETNTVMWSVCLYSFSSRTF